MKRENEKRQDPNPHHNVLPHVITFYQYHSQQPFHHQAVKSQSPLVERWYQCFRLGIGGIMTAVRVGWQERAYVLWAGLLLSCFCGRAMLGSPAVFCLRDTQAQRDFEHLRFGTSLFNGVHWDRRLQKFRARVRHQHKLINAGCFLNESEAACAFDEKLRSICNDPVRLKKSLNFPTDQESGSII